MELNVQLLEDIKIKLPPIPRGCLQLFEDKDKSFVIIADEKMALSIYQCSENDFKEVFKAAFDAPISSVLVSDDLVFFNVGSEVKAITKKGKQLYSFNTFQAGAISKILVAGFKLFVAGNEVVNEFLMSETLLTNNKSRRGPTSGKKTEDVSVFLSEDDINDSTIYQNGKSSYCVILRANNQIQILEGGKAISSHQTGSSPTCCTFLSGQEQGELLVGQTSGSIVALQVLPKGNGLVFSRLWSIDSNDRKVSSILVFPKGVFVARSNQIQLWCPDQTEHQRVWKSTSSSAVTNCCYVTRSRQIVFSTINGQVIGLSNYEAHVSQGKIKIEQSKVQNIKAQQVLQNLMEQRKLLLQREPSSNNRLKHTFTLNHNKKCWILEISSSLPVNNVVLYGVSGVRTDYVVQFQSLQNQSQVFQIADLTELQFELELSEGNQKLIQCFVTLGGSVQVAVSINLQIQALCLHYKVSNVVSSEMNTAKMHSMTITGSFTKAQFNILLLGIFNQTVKTVSEESVVLVYESLLTKQKVICTLDDKTFTLYAQSINPLVIVRKLLQEKSREKEMSTTISVKPNKEAVEESLRLIQPQILQLEQLEKENRMLPQLLQFREESGSMNSYFKDVLGRREEIQRDYQQKKGRYNALKQVLTQMYVNFKESQNSKPTDTQVQAYKRKIQKFKIQEIKASIL